MIKIIYETNKRAAKGSCQASLTWKVENSETKKLTIRAIIEYSDEK